MKAFWIRSDTKTIEAVEYSKADDLGPMVGGGMICLACTWPNGDTLYVNDEGLYKFDTFFTVPDGHQPFAGNGVLVGAEREDDNLPNGYETLDPTITIEDLKAGVKFLTRDEARRLAQSLGI